MSENVSKRDRTAPTQGTYEEAVALLGRRSPVNFGTHPVSEVRIAQYCALIEVEYAKVRASFNAPIGAYQSIQHPLARAKTYVEAARTMMYLAAEKHDRGEPIGLQANMVKILSSEAFKMAAEIAMTTFGGAGVDVTQDILPFYIAAQNNTVAPVNNQIVLSYIAEKALGLPKSY